MTLAAEVRTHLPYLRRYARALNGSQESGDAYVAATLEAIITENNPPGASTDARLWLYSTFTKLWESVALNIRQDTNLPEWEQATQRRLSSLSSRAREAFLLVAVEGFAVPQVAQILGRDEESERELLAEASSTILDDVATDVLIIEDEPIVSIELEQIVESIGHRVIGIARTETEALRHAVRKQPGLVLADIQLADGSSGISAVNKMLGGFNVPVIFITAFPEKLLTGEGPEPAFLITKPFSPDMVKAVISQALFFDMKPRKVA